jgi:hypothetical protein
MWHACWHIQIIFCGVSVTNWHCNDVKYGSACSSCNHASHATSFCHILKCSMNELCTCLMSHIWALGCHHATTGVTELLWRCHKHQCIWSINHAIPWECHQFGRQQLHMKTLMS